MGIIFPNFFRGENSKIFGHIFLVVAGGSMLGLLVYWLAYGGAC